jgi:cell division protein FtsZ
VDTVIAIPNERHLQCVEKGTSLFDAFRIADDILRQAVQGISDIITIPGIINRDFADVKAIMKDMGMAVMGTAVASGENRAVDAAKAAIASPLLEDQSVDGARGVLINVTGSSNLSLHEVHEASTIIYNAAHEDANIIFGAVQDESMKDKVKITVIATGFGSERAAQPKPAAAEPFHGLHIPGNGLSGRANDPSASPEVMGPAFSEEKEIPEIPAFMRRRAK